MNVKRLVLHHENASFHSARIAVRFLVQQQQKIKVIKHALCSPDLAKCEYFFFKLKKLCGCHFHSKHGIDKTIKEYFPSIPRNG